jgi:hypothetical protein
MKSHLKSASPQLNLALVDRAPTELPRNERQELSVALVELLVSAAAPHATVPASRNTTAARTK